MSKRYVINEETLVAIANAIREKARISGDIRADDFAHQILSMSSADVGEIEKTLGINGGIVEFIHTQKVNPIIVEKIKPIRIQAINSITIGSISDSVGVTFE